MAESPHPVDVHIGKRIRLRRQQLHISQEKVAAALGLTFQQVQKYEGGRNRVSGSKMFLISQLLGVTPNYFYEGLEMDLLGPVADDVTPKLMDAYGVLPDIIHLPLVPSAVRKSISNLIAATRAPEAIV